LVALLEIDETVLELSQRGKVFRSEDLSVDDGEVDLDLVEPAGMNRGMNQEGVGPKSARPAPKRRRASPDLAYNPAKVASRFNYN